MSAADGGPAFPAQFYDERATGQTLRDYFATHAPITFEQISQCECGKSQYQCMSEARYEYADAMIAARNK